MNTELNWVPEDQGKRTPIFYPFIFVNFEVLKSFSYSKNFIVYKKKADSIKPNVIEDVEAYPAGGRVNQ